MKHLILTLFFFTICNAAFSNDSTKKNQNTVPSINVKTLDGETVDIQSYIKKGEITIISFWATWCGPCIKELDNINDVYEEWQQKYGCNLVAVTIDDTRNLPKVKPFVTGRAWPYTILTDENKDLARAMNVNNPPLIILVDKEGNIVYTHNGYSEGAEFELEEAMKKLLETK